MTTSNLMNPQSPTTKPQLLVVEDQINLSIVYTLAAERAGYDVLQVHNGADARATLRTFVPDVILLDLQLPFVDGETILKEIRADDRLKNAYVIIATANSRLGEYLAHHADSFLTKPVLYNQLLHIFNRLYDQSDGVNVEQISGLNNLKGETSIGNQPLY